MPVGRKRNDMMRVQTCSITCCILVALCSVAQAKDYVLSLELREYRGRFAHDTVAPVFGAKLVNGDGIWDSLKKMNYSTLTQVEVKVAPHAKHAQQTRLGGQTLDVTINTGDLGDGRESSAIKLRYCDSKRISEVKDSRHLGVMNRSFFLYSEIVKLPNNQGEVTLLWIANLKSSGEIGQQNGAANGASSRR